MHTLGIGMVIVGVLGMLLGFGLHCYGATKHDSGWLCTAQDTAHRAILVTVLGLILLALSELH